jgi:formylglycine-generating enzyme required for sulfatase activity
LPEQKPRIFLCHASEDKPRVAELYHQLKDAGYHPWLDKYDLLPGQDWWNEIEKVISNPYNLVVVCITSQSVSKRGVVQKEINQALSLLDQVPEDTIYLIPARMEPCQSPKRISRLHWVDLFEPDGFENLRRAIDFELEKRKIQPTPMPEKIKEILALTARYAAMPELLPFEPEMILIPAGEFIMGSDPNVDKKACGREQPLHTLYLPDYYMAQTPITNTQYAAFVQATDHRQPLHWEIGQPPTGKQDHPVVNVSWHDIVAYCNWLSEVTGRLYRLPSEAEWEKAARGTEGQIYPWGNEWDKERCNTSEGGKGGTTPVGVYPDGASPYGLLDMAGNVWEWTLSLWGKGFGKPDFKYPYQPEDGRENVEAGEEFIRVVRGGSWNNIQSGARCAFRSHSTLPYFRSSSFGCRLVSPV